MSKKEQKTISIASRFGARLLWEAGYQEHPKGKGKGWIRKVGRGRRFHAYVAKKNVEIHYDVSDSAGIHHSTFNDDFFDEMARVSSLVERTTQGVMSNAEKERQEKNEELCRRYPIDLKAAVRELVRFKVKPVKWIPKDWQTWFIKKLIDIEYVKPDSPL